MSHVWWQLGLELMSPAHKPWYGASHLNIDVEVPCVRGFGTCGMDLKLCLVHISHRLIFLSHLDIFLSLVLGPWVKASRHVSEVLRDIGHWYPQAVAEIFDSKLRIEIDLELSLCKGRKVAQLDSNHVLLCLRLVTIDGSLSLSDGVLILSLSLLSFLNIGL